MIPAGTKVYFAREPADLRKSFDGLAALAAGALQKNPRAGGMFVFLNKRGDQVRVLFKDKDGWCVLSKRLDKGRFRPPTMEQGEFCWESETKYLMTFLSDIDLRRGVQGKQKLKSNNHLHLVPPTS